jgi:hypothetical protein
MLILYLTLSTTNTYKNVIQFVTVHGTNRDQNQQQNEDA